MASREGESSSYIEWHAENVAERDAIAATGAFIEEQFQERGVMDQVRDVLVYAPNQDGLTTYIVRADQQHSPSDAVRAKAGLQSFQDQITDLTTGVALHADRRRHDIQIFSVAAQAEPHPVTSKVVLGPNPQVLARFTFPQRKEPGR